MTVLILRADGLKNREADRSSFLDSGLKALTTCALPMFDVDRGTNRNLIALAVRLKSVKGRRLHKPNHVRCRIDRGQFRMAPPRPVPRMGLRPRFPPYPRNRRPARKRLHPGGQDRFPSPALTSAAGRDLTARRDSDLHAGLQSASEPFRSWPCVEH